MPRTSQHPKHHSFNVRVDPALKAAFRSAAQAADQPASQVLREFMQHYVAWHRQAAFAAEARRQSAAIAARAADPASDEAVVLADDFAALPAVTVLPLTSAVHEEKLVRVTVSPSVENGLLVVSQVMVDKASTVGRGKIGGRMGRLEVATLQRVDAALARFLGLPAAA